MGVNSDGVPHQRGELSPGDHPFPPLPPPPGRGDYAPAEPNLSTTILSCCNTLPLIFGPSSSLHSYKPHALLDWNQKDDGSQKKKGPKVRKQGVAVFGQSPWYNKRRGGGGGLLGREPNHYTATQEQPGHTVWAAAAFKTSPEPAPPHTENNASRANAAQTRGCRSRPGAWGGGRCAEVTRGTDLDVWLVLPLLSHACHPHPRAPSPQNTRRPPPQPPGGTVPNRAVLRGKQQDKRVRNANRNNRSQGCSLGKTRDHRSIVEQWFVAVGEWRLAVGGTWRLVVGGSQGLSSRQSTPPPLYKLRQCTQLSRSLRLLWLGQRRGLRTTHTTASTHVCRPHVLKGATPDLWDASD